MPDRVTVEVHAGVADVRLSRPGKRNAMDLAMLDGLIDAGLALAGDGSLRAVVLSGEGPSFCAGLDLSLFENLLGKGAAEAQAASIGALDHRDGETASVAQQAVHVWRALPVPVIAAVHGHALGGGLQLALGADVRIVAPDAQLSVLEIRWGLIPDMTGTLVLAALVGSDVAKELTWTGRMLSGEEAFRLGLATRVSESPREDALALAGEIAANSPSAVRAAKVLLDQASRASFEEGLLAEQRAQRRLIGSPDQIEAVLAYFEKRPGRFGN
ncbi:MAG: crotonase/enoyl-CoA hydratase family protein [Acidimicrobiales bacterium]